MGRKKLFGVCISECLVGDYGEKIEVRGGRGGGGKCVIGVRIKKRESAKRDCKGRKKEGKKLPWEREIKKKKTGVKL